jgi:hypothetical protein
MKDINEEKKTLREVDKSKYPELGNYTKDAIWQDISKKMAFSVRAANVLTRNLPLSK